MRPLKPDGHRLRRPGSRPLRSPALTTSYDYYVTGDTSGTAGSLKQLTDPLTSGTVTYTYDAWGGTIHATAGATSIDYGLDAFERTVSRGVVGGTATSFTYQGASETLVKAAPSSGSATTYSSTPGGPLSSKTGTATALESLRDLHGDTVGTFTAAPATTQMTDETWYSPFGEPTPLAGGLPLLGFQGQLTDPATGTVDMLTRQYVPTLGRFATRDVLGGDPASPPSLNQWVYAAGSPVSYTDPSGLCGNPDACPAPPDTDEDVWYEHGSGSPDVNPNVDPAPEQGESEDPSTTGDGKRGDPAEPVRDFLDGPVCSYDGSVCYPVYSPPVQGSDCVEGTDICGFWYRLLQGYMCLEGGATGAVLGTLIPLGGTTVAGAVAGCAAGIKILPPGPPMRAGP